MNSAEFAFFNIIIINIYLSYYPIKFEKNENTFYDIIYI